MAARVTGRLQGVVSPGDRIVAGLSGGLDSVVLLDCLAKASRALHFRLSALHVNHQLSPNASRWSVFCRRLCRARGIDCESVAVRVERGAGPEAAARAARYAIFARQQCDYVALAHHRDDQVETVLLQLLRGAGVKGLAGMPFLRDEGGERRAEENGRRRHSSSLRILRPLLDATRQEILAYAHREKLKWIEDESNLDTRYRRNFLRHEILPRLARQYPAYRDTVARSAAHLAEAAVLMDEIALADAEGFLRDGGLAVAGLRRLTPARARNLLRWFLARQGVTMPAAQRLEEALRQILDARQDARVVIDLEGATLRRYQHHVYVVRAPGTAVPYTVRWQGEKRLALPGGAGTLVLASATGKGISLARLRAGQVTVRSRQGGERIKVDARRPRRSLKNLLQERGLAPWLRERLPLLFCGDELVWAAGIGVDCAFRARRGEPARDPRWLATG